MNFLRESEALRHFILEDVELTGNELGSGSYGSVVEVSLPALSAGLF